MVRFLIYLLFFFTPAAGSLPGRAWSILTGLDVTLDTPLRALLVPSTLIGLLIIALRAAERPDPDSQAVPTPVRRPYQAPLLLWFVAATVSVVANDPSPEGWSLYVAGFISGLVVYVALRDVTVDAALYRGIFVSLSLGALIPLVHAGIEVYGALGIPSLATLFVARSMMTLMAGYYRVFFGHPTVIAAWLVLVLPPLLSLALDPRQNAPRRFLFGVTATLCAVHLAVTFTRGAILAVMLGSALIVILRRQQRGVVALAAITTLTFGVFSYLQLDALSTGAERLVDAALVRESDRSVLDRKEAIEIGWTLFEAHPFAGIGPTETLTRHPLTSTHQFNVQEAAELGLLGLVASIWLVIAALPPLLWPFRRAPDEETMMRFTLVCGPMLYLLYNVAASAVLTVSVSNCWAIMLVGFLALSENRIIADDAKALSAPPGIE